MTLNTRPMRLATLTLAALLVLAGCAAGPQATPTPAERTGV